MKKRFIAVVMALTLVLATGSPMSLLAENTSKQVADKQQSEMTLPENETDIKEADNKKSDETEVVKPEKRCDLSHVGDLETGSVAVTDQSKTEVSLDEESQYQVFKFVPQETKSYNFFSDAGNDTYVYLYQKNESEYVTIGEPGNWDDGNDDGDFLGSYELTAGETYYFLVSYYYGEDAGTFRFYLSSTCTNAEDFTFAGKEVVSRTITNIPRHVFYDYEDYSKINVYMDLSRMCITYTFDDESTYDRTISNDECSQLSRSYDDTSEIIGKTFTVLGETYDVYWKYVKFDDDEYYMDETKQDNALCIDIDGVSYGEYLLEIRENPIDSISLNSAYYSANNKVFISNLNCWYNPLDMSEFVLTATKTDGTTYDMTWEDGELVGCEEGMSNSYSLSFENIYYDEDSDNDYYIMGDNTLTISYAGKTATFDIYLYGLRRFEVVTPVVHSLGTYPHEADSYVPSMRGLKLKAYLTDGTTEIVEVDHDDGSYLVWKDSSYDIFPSSGNYLLSYQNADDYITEQCDVGDYIGKSYDTYPGLKTITPGSSTFIKGTPDNPYAVFKFVPTVTAKYICYSTTDEKKEIDSTESKDTYAKLYEGNKFMDDCDDATEDNLNFSIEKELSAGKAYYFVTSSLSTSRTCEYTVHFKVSTLLPQTITAPASITKTSADGSFNLGAKALGGAKLTYVCSNPSVAKVDNNGNVTIVDAGSATISVTAAATDVYAAATKKINLTVTKAKNYITVKEEFNKVHGSRTFKLNAKSGGKMTYKTSNKKVATVDKKGRVTIKKCGQAVITITSKVKGISDATKKVVINVVPKKAALKSLKSSKAGQMTVSWKKQSEAKGYIIEYSTDKKFKVNVTTVQVKKNKTTSKTIKKLKKGTTYYVRVTAYTNVDGKPMKGSTSKAKKVKVKK